jgi:hypothetical protein
MSAEKKWWTGRIELPTLGFQPVDRPGRVRRPRRCYVLTHPSNLASPEAHDRAEMTGLRRHGLRARRESGPCGLVPGAVAEQRMEDPARRRANATTAMNRPRCAARRSVHSRRAVAVPSPIQGVLWIRTRERRRVTGRAAARTRRSARP